MLRQTGLLGMTSLLVLAFQTNAPAQTNAAAPLSNTFQPTSANASKATTSANAANSTNAATPAADNDRVRDGLIGPVRRVRTEVAKLVNKSGKMVEQPRALLETAAYDLRGNKTETAYFPVTGSTLTGKEVYKYDEKGNISEMTLQGPDGSLLSKENYAYDYDFVGNWTKMTTSVAVIEEGKLSFEQVEVTYRTISYYLDENMVKMVQPAASSSSPVSNSSGPVSPAPVAATTASAVKPNAQPSNANGAATPNKESGAAKPAMATALPAATSVDRSKVSGPDGVAAAGKAGGNPVVLMDAEPPAKATPKPLLKPVSGGVLNGTAISLPKPVYTETAKRLRAAGTVSVEVIVDETGKIISARATSGNTLLREAAVQAAQKARFSPTKISGQPVKVSGIITYTFTLEQ